MENYTKQELEKLLENINIKLRDLEIQKALINHYLKRT